MKVYKVENMTKTYGEKTLFDNISFSIAEKERVGLIGINGTGKSTLLKCLAGKDHYDEANITHSNDYTIKYLPQNVSFNEELTVLDCIFSSDTKIIKLLKQYEEIIEKLAINPTDTLLQGKLFSLQELMDKEDAWDASSKAKTILSKLGITSYNRKIGDLSGGQQKRVALANVLIETPDLLLLDEPTNHLDFETIEWLEKYLKGYQNSILVITHDRYFLDNITTRTFELDNGNLYEYTGNYSSFLEKKAEREANEESQYQKNKKLYKKELEWIRSGVKARTTKQQARIKRFDDLEEKLLTSKAPNENLNISLDASRIGKQVFEIENICKKFENKKIVENFSYIIKNNARIGIVGLNGVGKSTFLKLLAEKERLDSGIIKTGQTVKIAYYSQLIEDMNPSLRVINYVREGAEAIKNIDGSVISAAQLLERFLFPMYMHGTIIEKLSGGEKRRLYLLRLLMEQPNVLLLDEPTNDLDTQTLTILEEFLETFNGVVVTVSHDRYFLDKVVDELLVFQGEAKIIKFNGNYSEYINSGGNLFVNKQESSQKTTLQNNNNKLEKTKKKLTYSEKKEWETIDGEIAELENLLIEIEQEMANVATNFTKLNELTEQQEEIKQKLEEKLCRWEYLAEIAEY